MNTPFESNSVPKIIFDVNFSSKIYKNGDQTSALFAA
jgi:hypothetical protein